MITNIRAWGNSQGLYIPKRFLKELGISINDPVEIIIDGDRLIIKKDTGVSKKEAAWASLQAIRSSFDPSKSEMSNDYRKEFLEHLDEKYGI